MSAATDLTNVLIPIRSFRDSKSRLAAALNDEERAALTKTMAARVVAAAAGLPVHIITDDDEVADWAADLDAGVIAPGITGLTASVTEAVRQRARAGVDRVIVAHADLPGATDLGIVNRPGVCIAPDRANDGSNVICVDASAGFGFSYGPASFVRHCSEAHRLDLPLTIVQHPSLAWDVDDPIDLPSDWKDR